MCYQFSCVKLARSLHVSLSGTEVLPKVSFLMCPLPSKDPRASSKYYNAQFLGPHESTRPIKPADMWSSRFCRCHGGDRHPDHARYCVRSNNPHLATLAESLDRNRIWYGARFYVPFNKNRSFQFRRRSSQPISWLGTEKKQNTTKLSNNIKPK